MDIRKKFFLVALAIFFSLPFAKAEDLSAAEAFYKAGEWEKARQVYQDLFQKSEARDRLPASFFYNYGTVLAQAKAFGSAYPFLLRAAYAKPFDSDIRANLSLVSAQLPAASLQVKPANWLPAWPMSLRFISWRYWLTPALLALAIALWLVPSPKRKNAARVAFALAFVLGILTAITYSQTRPRTAGIIANAKVKGGPAASFPDITDLQPGSLVSEEEARDGWVKVRFQKGDSQVIVGWVEASTILGIN